MAQKSVTFSTGEVAGLFAGVNAAEDVTAGRLSARRNFDGTALGAGLDKIESAARIDRAGVVSLAVGDYGFEDSVVESIDYARSLGSGRGAGVWQGSRGTVVVLLSLAEIVEILRAIVTLENVAGSRVQFPPALMSAVAILERAAGVDRGALSPWAVDDPDDGPSGSSWGLPWPPVGVLSISA